MIRQSRDSWGGSPHTGQLLFINNVPADIQQNEQINFEARHYNHTGLQYNQTKEQLRLWSKHDRDEVKKKMTNLSLPSVLSEWAAGYRYQTNDDFTTENEKYRLCSNSTHGGITEEKQLESPAEV